MRNMNIINWAITTMCFTSVALGQAANPDTPGTAVQPRPDSPSTAAPTEPGGTALGNSPDIRTNSVPSAELPAVTTAPTYSGNAPAPINPEAPLETGPTPMKGKWNPVLYGFVEFDAIHDSTQSYNEVAGNATIQNPSSYAGKHGRTQFGARNSRLGIKLSAPKMGDVQITGILEMDFLGNQPGTPPSPAVSENAYFTSPTFRMRHYAMKIENPYVDILVGQYWQLFGWQTYFHPAAVEIQGLPGQLFARSPQVRLSHTFKTEPVNVELAVAAARPPQRDSEVPDGQAGLRLMLNNWKGVHTMGGAGTAADALAIGLSGVTRQFALAEYTAIPSARRTTSGWGVSVDALLPILPGTMDDRGNSLTVTASFVTGAGIGDLYTGLTGGATTSWPLPNPTNVATPAYVSDIDSGLVEFDANGDLHAIKWRSFMAGIQYYLPPNGQLWLALNYSQMKSSNILDYVADATRPNLYHRSEWYDANLFLDATVATRFGIEYAHTKQTFGDDSKRSNDRLQFSGWLLF
ncbi:MAG TPA: hypothetical protein VIV60_06250 [Polyangiaceae bacterium]